MPLSASIAWKCLWIETDSECVGRLFAKGINLLINEVPMHLFSTTSLKLLPGLQLLDVEDAANTMLNCHTKLQ